MPSVADAFLFAEQAHAAVRTPAALRTFISTPNVQTAWNLGGKIVGVIGTERVVGALVKFGVKLALKSRAADEAAGEEMEELAKGRVPELTGTLMQGINAYREGDQVVFVASAIKAGYDYARIVEFGRKARRVADSAYFGDGSMPPQPFFYNSAREALEHRGQTLEDAIGSAAQEEGL